MISRHSVDTSVALRVADFQSLPERREIEDTRQPPSGPVRNTIVECEPYQPSDELIESVNLAIALGRPLLLQGEPGCGKTRLAYAVAYALGLPIEVATIKSTSRAQDLLYTYDAVRRLYDAQIKKQPRSSTSQLDVMNYITLGPLGRAIARAQFGRRSVVLIDEIDKADLDFPNDLLWELDRLEFSVQEAPQIAYAVQESALRPIVFITHNEEKALPPAFLRRCIYHYLEFPDREDDLLQILALHQSGDERLGRRAIQVLRRVRSIADLSRYPGISELLDWVGYLVAVQEANEELEKLPYVGALLKAQRDQQRARAALEQS